MSFKADGIRPVGLQPFPRTAAQKGYVLETDEQTNLRALSNVDVYTFRHDKEIAQEYCDYFKGGELLFPYDEITPLSNHILKTREISRETLDFNVACNPGDDKNRILKDIIDYKIVVKEQSALRFDVNNLKSYYEFIQNGGWEAFCDKIYNPYVEDNEKFIEYLKTIRYEDNYKEFFYPEYFDEDRMLARYIKYKEALISKNKYALDTLSL